MSATARSATTRPTTARRRPAPARATARRRPVLTEVPAAPAAVAGNGVFALVVVGLLLSGMGVLLVLNTTLAQGAFEIRSLTGAQSALAIQEQQLLQQVAIAESPESLQSRADALGMVPVASPVFLRLADGAVLGTPVPASAPPHPKSVPTVPVTGGSPATAAATTTTATATATKGATATAPAAQVRTAIAAGVHAAAAGAAHGPQSDAAVLDPTPTAGARP